MAHRLICVWFSVMDLFNYSLPFSRNPDGSIHFLDNDMDTKTAIILLGLGLATKSQSSILWAAKNRLDNYQTKVLLEKHKWCDYVQKTRRITDEELNLMGLKLCMALEYIERSLTIRNRRFGKKTDSSSHYRKFSLGASTLERGCREFLDLEYFSKRQEMYQHYALLPYQRVASGRSLIFECTAWTNPRRTLWFGANSSTKE